MPQSFYSWRDELREVADDIPSSKPETDTGSKKKIDPKNVKNKIVINPPMREAFEEIGGTLLEVVEIEEDLGTLQMKRAKQEQQVSRTDMRIAAEKSKEARDAKRNNKEVDNTDQQVKEGINIKKSDMGDVVKDFYKSDAPQFKGKSKKKRREMAIAAKLETEKPQ